MAGIFLNGGVACTQTLNAACDIVTVGEGCDASYYPLRCNVAVDPLQMNAVISEIANAVNAFGDSYDCTRLDNLKNALAEARDICGLPPFVDAPDLDDRIAGCFDNVSSTISVQQLVQLVLSQSPTLCQLPEVASIAENDTLAGCFGNAEGRISLANLRNSFGGAVGGVRLGAEIYNNWAPSGGHNVVVGTGGVQAFICKGDKEGQFGPSPGAREIVLSIGRPSGPMNNPHAWMDYYTAQSAAEGTALVGGRMIGFGFCFRSGNNWYIKSGEVITDLGPDEGQMRFTCSMYAKFQIWQASFF